MDEYDSDFIEMFWTYYPKKVGKFNAQKEWRKRRFNPVDQEKVKRHLIARVKEDVRWLPNEKGKTFIVDPERFLKDRRDHDIYEKSVVVALRERRYYDVEEPEAEVHTADQAIAKRAIEQALAELKVRH